MSWPALPVSDLSLSDTQANKAHMQHCNWITQQLPHSLNPKCVYMTKTLALKLHQALRNPVQPEANGIMSGHYNTLEASDHWHQLFYSPLVSLLKVNVHCYKEHRGRKQQGKRLASNYKCRGSSLFSEAPSAGQWKKKQSLTSPDYTTDKLLPKTHYYHMW